MTARPSALLSALVVAAAGPFLGATAAYADAPAPYNATINQGNVPATAAHYSQGCDEFAGKPSDSDGWLFVASPSNFTDFEGIFDNGTVTLNGANPAGTSTFFAKADDHLAVITPAGWTLTQAYATLDGDRDFFTLSHTCAASQAAPEAGGTGGDDQGSGGDATGSGNGAGEGQGGGEAVGPGGGGGDDQSGGGVDQSGAGGDSVGAGDGGGDQTGGGGGSVGPDTGVGGGEAGAGRGADVGTSGQSGQASGGGAVGRTPTRVLGERVTRSAAGASQSGIPSQSGTTSAAGAGNLPFTGSVVTNLAPAAGVVVLVGIALCWAGRRPRSRMQA